MTVVGASRPNPGRVAWLRQATCTRKQPRTRAQAMRAAARARAQGDRMGAYRCVFDPSHWHVGHGPGMRTLEALAAYLRNGRDPTTSPLVPDGQAR